MASKYDLAKTWLAEGQKREKELWRSRIQKRIDELQEAIEGFELDISNSVECDLELFSELKIVKHELEGLLK
jgi:hypothetical protein